MRRPLMLLFVLGLTVAGGIRTAAAAPPAPTLVAPADTASVLAPFTISWSAVSDPNGIVAYNWQISPSSNFANVIKLNSTMGPTEDTVTGLGPGTYFWRVQAVNGAFVQGAWSAARSFTITGTGPGTPGTPTLNPTHAYSTFHPMEAIRFSWSAVPDAAKYELHAARDPSFPISSLIKADNIPTTTTGFAIANPEGNYWARVFAVNADGIYSAPSNVIEFSVFYNNPIGPPPVPVSPVNGATLTLPITITWEHVPNPQPSGYELQIARDSSFSSIEEHAPQLNGPSREVLSLTSGTKFWRLRSTQGDSSPTTAAMTAWSPTRTFTIPSVPPTPVSVTLTKNPLYGGEDTWVQVQLATAAPPSGAAIAMSSSRPSVLAVPATIPMQGNIAWTQFMSSPAAQVTTPTQVTITATLNGTAASTQVTVLPPSLKALSIMPIDISGGADATAFVELNGQAPAGGAVVSLASNSPVASPPATVTVPAGSFSAFATVATSAVTSTTTATITASWQGVSALSQVRVRSAQPPTSLTLSPATVVGGDPGSVSGTVTVAAEATYDEILQVTSSHPATASVSCCVTIPMFMKHGGFSIFTSAVSAQTLVTISVTGGGVTRSATLTVNPPGSPPPAATLSSFSVSPTSVVGGNPATGTVTLASAAPAGGSVVTLGSNQPGSASVPASVTVPAGATGANFTVTTFPSQGTTVQLNARLGDTILFASIGVNPEPPPPTPTAPSLVSPANAATGLAQPVTLDWNDVANATSYEVQVDDSSTIAAPFTANSTVTASQATLGGLPAQQLWWRVRAQNSAGVFGPFSSARSFTPQGAPAAATLSTVAVSPSSVVGGNGSTGTVTLTAGAPSGGALVSLSSSNTAVASVPANVTVSAGATSATFAATTSSVTTSTPVTITATNNGTSKTTTLTVTPPGQAVTLTVTATGRSGERVISNPAGINVNVGTTGSASFNTGTSITLSVTNGRDAIWSGACSSGGEKEKTCTFTIAANASVTGNVQ